ncbi:hypothetical protein HID58_052101 [Brassica napus]|uniref:Syntaxin 6/10/61 N-terminal domain-containing protein n=1 Tax=Brassica napus TaxID=3708 RepID=A0ABQ8ABL5_BRANA|nr:hypothetical protein HID58_052101 [Brassica napus]
MMVAKSFDLWQKDVFFSAAEEVQQSADTMESACRLWIKEKRESGRVSVESDHLSNELQAALSTAKWQLEEFGRAVRLSHGRCRDDTTLTRHKQFVSAIENQIHRVQCCGERTPVCVIDIDDERGSPESASNRNGTRGTWSSPNVPDIRALRINVPLEEEENKRNVSQTEATPKEKGYKPLFWMQRCRDYNQLFDRVRYYQRRFGVPLNRPVRIPFNRPVQLILSLALLLSLLLLFRVY